MSRFWYTLFVSPIPEWALTEIKNICVNFVWNNKSHVIINKKCEGGLQLVDIACKYKAFRLKFLARLLDDEYVALWKYTFKYFMSKIFNMKLTTEVLFMKIPSFELKCVPIVYREMLEAWYTIQDKCDIKLTVKNIYDQPLFKNPKILLKGKTILWNDFINAGIVCLKDICYEVKTGFLPDIAIIDIIQAIYDNYTVKYITD